MCAREKPYKMGRVQIVGADLAGLWLCPNFKAIVQKKEMLYPNFKSHCSKKNAVRQSHNFLVSVCELNASLVLDLVSKSAFPSKLLLI